jgi:broad specificity phosphatase PhoE
LTAEVTAPPTATRPGAIVLTRHGEPALARNVKLSSGEYREFWAQYEVMGLLPGQSPPQALVAVVETCGVLVSSTRLRSIESAEKLAAGRAYTRESLLIEAPLPPPRWPSWIRMSPKLWGFFARVWWWYFTHHEGQETRADAEARADRAALMLAGLAEKGQDVVVTAHGFFNHLVGRALRRRGWRLTASEGYKYWSTRRFERL